MSAGTRYRLVIDQGEERHVSSVVLGPDEVEGYLLVDAALHKMHGWCVVYGTTDGIVKYVICEKGATVRRITIASFDPLTDVVR